MIAFTGSGWCEKTRRIGGPAIGVAADEGVRGW